MDFDGKARWKASGARLVCALAEKRFLAVRDSGEATVLHATDGHVENWGAELGVSFRAQAWREGEHVFFLDGEKLLIADLWLKPIRRVSLSGNQSGAIFSAGHIYLESGSIVFSDFERSKILCSIPVDMAEAAMSQWEDETGKPAISGFSVEGSFDPSAIVAALENPKKQQSVPVGRRFGYRWLLEVEPKTGLVFLANGYPPHLLACIGLDGRPRWCVYLSGACCGGLPRPLANGRYVISSGCGGILSWIDHDGRVVAQSKPHEGVGLATAFSNQVVGLPDSGCVVEGGPGVVSFGPDGEVRWVWEHYATTLACAPARDSLLTVSWTSRSDDSKVVSIACARGLGMRAFVH
jgi:hypothetical protein